MTNKTSTELIRDAITLAGNNGNTYLTESSIFEHLLTQQVEQAQRTMRDLDADIDRLQAEITERVKRREDLMAVIIRANAALGVPLTPAYQKQETPAPALQSPVESPEPILATQAPTNVTLPAGEPPEPKGDGAIVLPNPIPKGGKLKELLERLREEENLSVNEAIDVLQHSFDDANGDEERTHSDD